MRRVVVAVAVAVIVGATGVPAARQAATSALPTPMAEWKHNIGDDYFLVDYKQLTAYWTKLAKVSNRLHVVDIGKTAEGRPMLMAVITSPANYAKTDRYRDIARRLALAEGVSDPAAHALAKEGKAVVWIDGGL